MEKWKVEYLDEISKKTNEEVLDEYSYLVGGDDYDGCYTRRGGWKFEKITIEFMKRLVEHGYLKE